MSDPKETQDKWITVVPTSRSKQMLAQAHSVPVAPSDLLTPPPPLSLSSPGASLSRASHSYVILLFWQCAILFLPTPLLCPVSWSPMLSLLFLPLPLLSSTGQSSGRVQGTAFSPCAGLFPTPLTALALPGSTLEQSSFHSQRPELDTMLASEKTQSS